MRSNKYFIEEMKLFDNMRTKEAIKEGFDPGSTEWVVHRFQDELSVIRKNFQHGFISWGWYDQDRKILVADLRGYDKPFQKKFYKLAESMAKTLNED